MPSSFIRPGLGPTCVLQNLARAALGALAALLVACGPGVGGTGTGASSALDSFGASAASACSGELAALLSCTPANASATAPPPAAAPVVLADAAANRRIEVLLQGNQAELLAPCVGLRFRGDWGLVVGQAAQAARYYGVADSGATAAPASLSVRLSGEAVQVTLRDLGEQVLLGPVLLSVVPGSAPPGSC